jgi:predicted ATPase
VPVANRAVAGKLPAESTSFVGRRRLLAEVKAAFANTRLLTLVGPGGVGKTRLALRAGIDLRRTVRDGVWFIDLAGLDDPHLVAKAVITGLGVADRSGQWPTSLLVAHLASREALLILDNCEHLLDAVAVLADVVLKEAAGVRLLATSRQALGISGERVLQVPPLTLRGEVGSAHSEAVELFMARAADAGVELEDTEATRELVLDLCRRLDGMPLALELAAVRLRTIGLEELIARLGDRFALLTGGSRAAMPRQQTLMAAIDWSHGLLSGPEAALLRRLSVFHSDFGLDAAEAVARETGVESASVLEVLSSLIEKSFVSRLGTAAWARYRLHETMREYALIKLRAADEEAAAIKAFVRYYAGV